MPRGGRRLSTPWWGTASNQEDTWPKNEAQTLNRSVIGQNRGQHRGATSDGWTSNRPKTNGLTSVYDRHPLRSVGRSADGAFCSVERFVAEARCSPRPRQRTVRRCAPEIANPCGIRDSSCLSVKGGR